MTEDIQLDSNWLAWAAGFIDGEGSIQIARARREKRDLPPHKRLWNAQIDLYMRANQVDPRPLEKLREMFGGSLFLREARKNQKINGQQPQWVWTVSGKAAYEAAKLMRPWLIVKADRADIAMKFYELCSMPTARELRDTKPGGGLGRLKVEQVALRQEFYVQMAALQLKGPETIQ